MIMTASNNGRQGPHLSTADDRLLWPQDVSELLGVPVDTLYQWRCRRVGPRAIRVGRHLRYRRAEVYRWLAEQEDAS